MTIGARVFGSALALVVASATRAAPPAPTGSIGGYGSGSLVGGVAMPDVGPDHELAFPSRCYTQPDFALDYADPAQRDNFYGHPRTVAAVLAVAASVRAAHPDAPRLVVAELSNANGGPIPHHLTHQNGLDVDVMFLQRDPVPACTPYGGHRRFEAIDPTTGRWRVTPDFELAWNWALAERFAARPDVKAIFVGELIEDALGRWARAHGVGTEARARTLAKLVPVRCGGPTRSPFYKGNWCPHDDHFHVRFTCPEDSRACRNRVR